MAHELAFNDLSGDPRVLRAVLQRMGLIEGDAPFTAEALAGGVSSSVLKIAVGGRVCCIKQALPKLKVAKDWRAPVDRVFSEVAWLTTVAGIVPHAVPDIIAVDRPTGCFAMAFLPDADFPNWKALMLAGHVDVAFAAAVGRTLGVIHARTAHDPAIARGFANDDTFYAMRLEPYLAETARHHPALETKLLSILDRTRDTRHVLVHGDVSPKNILVGREGPVFIDAECAWYGDPVFDVAFCVNHFLLKAVRDPARAELLLRSFLRFGEAYLGEVGWEPRADAESRISSLLPCLTLGRIDGKSPIEYLDDAQRIRVRAVAARLVAMHPERLAEIADLWKKEFAA